MTVDIHALDSPLCVRGLNSPVPADGPAVIWPRATLPFSCRDGLAPCPLTPALSTFLLLTTHGPGPPELAPSPALTFLFAATGGSPAAALRLGL